VLELQRSKIPKPQRGKNKALTLADTINYPGASIPSFLYP